VVEGACEELLEELDALTEDDTLDDAEDDAEDALDVYFFFFRSEMETGGELERNRPRTCLTQR
jgi:hypothetical protein